MCDVKSDREALLPGVWDPAQVASNTGRPFNMKLPLVGEDPPRSWKSHVIPKVSLVFDAIRRKSLQNCSPAHQIPAYLTAKTP